jgi:hypothetical protein
MFRPVSAAGSASASSARQPPDPNRPPSPLTGRKLLAMPGFSFTENRHAGKADSQLRQVKINDLNFIHCTAATQKNKVELINVVAARINALPTDRPITIISLGSGGLLVEDLIFKQLSLAHQKQVRFRVIDPDYLKGRPQYQEYNAAIKSFKADKEAVKYVTSTTYLAAQLNGKRLAGSDQQEGPVIILAVNPPTQWGGDTTDTEERLALRGIPYSSESIDKANAILVELVTKSEHLNAAAQNIERLKKGYILDCHNSAMICSADQKGDFHFEVSPNFIAQFLFDYVRGDIRRQIDASGDTQDPPLQRLHKAVMSVVNNFKTPLGALGFSIMSGYDQSESELKEHFSLSKHPAIFASLRDNKVELNELN